MLAVLFYALVVVVVKKDIFITHQYLANECFNLLLQYKLRYLQQKAFVE